jgi:hypothetical protein
MQAVPFDYVAELATDYGAVECWWRESDRSFSGFVAEVWFDKQPAEFARRWAGVVGYPVSVRSRSDGFAAFALSIPCTIPEGDRSSIRNPASPTPPGIEIPGYRRKPVKTGSRKALS